MSRDPVPARYVKTAADRLAIERGYWWSPAAVDHALRFAATLRDPENPADKPFRFLRWQRDDVVAPLVGWRRPDGRRRFTTVSIWVPKKNGKTGLLAFLNLYFLLADGEPRPGCYVVSGSGQQAQEVYADASRMLTDTRWAALVKLIDYRNRMERRDPGGGRFQALASNAESAEGLRGSLICYDEVHVALRRRPRLYSAMRYAGTGRRQPLQAITSTAGDDRQTRPYRLYTRAQRIVAGESRETSILAVIYEAPDKGADDGEYTDAELAAANPAVGEILEFDQLRDDYAEARQSPDAADLEDFKRYRLNVWCKRSSAWLDVARWTACTREDEPPGLADRSCYAGIDLSSRLDLTAAVLVWPTDDGGLFIRPHFWLPADGIEARTEREMDYVAAADAGDITLIPGQRIDYSHVVGWIREQAEHYSIKAVGFDPWRAKELAHDLEVEGFDVVATPQGWRLSEACYRLEDAIATRTAWHTGNAVMAWCIENVERRTDNNGKIRPVKPVGEPGKRIDGAVAAIIATNLIIVDENDPDFFCG